MISCLVRWASLSVEINRVFVWKNSSVASNRGGQIHLMQPIVVRENQTFRIELSKQGGGRQLLTAQRYFMGMTDL
ncbi:MAG: hypothetical protein ACI97A_003602 [Planctomycetota bacterium]|jgi:hypothetical protein